MTLSAARLKKLKGRWKKAKAPSGGFTKLPEGTYQAEIKSVKVDATKKDKYLVKWELVIIAGKYKGKKLRRSSDLLYEGESGSGLDFFKGDLESCGLDMPDLSNAALKKIFKDLTGTVVEVYVRDNPNNTAYQQTFINQAINATSEDDDEEDFDEEEDLEEEDEEEDDEEEEEEDEEEEEEPEPPKATKKKAKKKASKKATKKKTTRKKAEPEVDEDEDFDDFDDDDDDEWDD